jgi:glycosyltransferase involved in cell wall biosynthesis
MHKSKLKILIICPYPLAQAPSQRFRFEQYLDQLGQAGIEWTAKPFFSGKTWRLLYTKGHYGQKLVGSIAGFISRFGILFFISGFDYVLIHRETAPIGPPFFEFVIARLFRKKIIYDFDDAIWLPNTSEENKLIAKVKWHSKVGAICKLSYKVSCGNNYLADFARKLNHNVVLNPTTIDTVLLHNPRLYQRSETPDNKIIVGWTGTHSTLKYLELLKPALQGIEEKYSGRVQFLVIADKEPKFELPSLIFSRWSKEKEIEDLMKIDIGVMPLPDDVWAKGKCGFKALQYMALEIPTLASPVGVNTEIIHHGQNGYLCRSDDDWVNYLALLIENKMLRKSIGQSARKTVVDHYSVFSNSPNFFSLFS